MQLPFPRKVTILKPNLMYTVSTNASGNSGTVIYPFQFTSNAIIYREATFSPFITGATVVSAVFPSPITTYVT